MDWSIDAFFSAQFDFNECIYLFDVSKLDDRVLEELEKYLSKKNNEEVYFDDLSWLALIPKSWETPVFMEEGTAFGCCSVKRYEYNDKFDIVIGYHS